jgi:hypothetical protein
MRSEKIVPMRLSTILGSAPVSGAGESVPAFTNFSILGSAGASPADLGALAEIPRQA